MASPLPQATPEGAQRPRIVVLPLLTGDNRWGEGWRGRGDATHAASGLTSRARSHVLQMGEHTHGGPGRLFALLPARQSCCWRAGQRRCLRQAIAAWCGMHGFTERNGTTTLSRIPVRLRSRR
jgi:hypothetical protein